MGIPTNGIVSDFQHQYMADKYRTVMATALKQYDNSAHPQSFYDAFAWEGLMGTGAFNESTALPANPTVAWSNIPVTERLAIRATRQNYLSNNSNSPCQ